MVTAKAQEGVGTTRLQEQFGYVYDAAGNLNSRTNNTLIQTFNVNNINQLTTSTNTGSLTVAGTTTIPASNVKVNGLIANRYADSTFALGGFVVTNGSNFFQAIGEDSFGNFSTNSIKVDLPATNNYAYDSNGNLLGDGIRNFIYDDENELVSICVSNTWSNSFAYDGKMRRRIERDYTWNAGWMETNEVHFIYDGNLVVEERDASNSPLVSYTRGNDLSGTQQGADGIGGMIARTTYGEEIPGAPTTAFYHADGNGNITAMIYPSQQIAARYLYDPYGNMLGMSGPLANLNKYRFSSKEWNNNANLYYYLYRYYDPTLQRWVSKDPVDDIAFITTILSASSINGAQPVSADVDEYSFVGNDGINTIDPLGLWSFYKWLYTGDGDISDELYDEVLDNDLDYEGCFLCCLKQGNLKIANWIASVGVTSTAYGLVPRPLANWITGGAMNTGRFLKSGIRAVAIRLRLMGLINSSEVLATEADTYKAAGTLARASRIGFSAASILETYLAIKCAITCASIVQ